MLLLLCIHHVCTSLTTGMSNVGCADWACASQAQHCHPAADGWSQARSGFGRAGRRGLSSGAACHPVFRQKPLAQRQANPLHPSLVHSLALSFKHFPLFLLIPTEAHERVGLNSGAACRLGR